MTDWVRAKNQLTPHIEVTKSRQSAQRPGWTILDKPAVDANGHPLPPTIRRPLGEVVGHKTTANKESK